MIVFVCKGVESVHGCASTERSHTPRVDVSDSVRLGFGCLRGGGGLGMMVCVYVREAVHGSASTARSHTPRSRSDVPVVARGILRAAGGARDGSIARSCMKVLHYRPGRHAHARRDRLGQLDGSLRERSERIPSGHTHRPRPTPQSSPPRARGERTRCHHATKPPQRNPSPAPSPATYRA
jgi:hypothetical protein